ncbi:uncharacterized protein LOC131147757 [Malania oleifera]|uniref:uncharacterized protein LOC131147757 n=1 Tax=Malania oleifera TaxID=397392 RepID=UPI0025AE310D|nr:uncharacterized protein LOC131147757 [Malania oleifera]
MCPLRLILIFLSATLAGFFVLRGLKSQPQVPDSDSNAAPPAADDPKASVNRSAKVLSAIGSGLRCFVDMASGRYLWTHLVSSSARSH